MPPLIQPPGPVYPPHWSPFPVRTRRVSNTAPGNQPHWVAVALAGRKGEDSERGWFESCYAVDLPTSTGGASEGGKGGSEACTAEREGEAIQALLRRSLPGAHLLRLVRLQDRGRWVRFVCERDAAISASSATDATVAATAARGDGTETAVRVARLFADPRDVVESDVLAAIEATASSIGSGGKTGGRTVGATDSLGDGGGSSDIARTAGGPQLKCAASVQVRCAEAARYAAVAFAPPLAKAMGSKSEGGGGDGSDGQWVNGDVRTLAVVSAVTGGVSEAPAGLAGGNGHGGGGRGIMTKPGGVIAAGASSAGTFDDDDGTKDPFLGVDPTVDRLTRASEVGVSSSPLIDGSGGDSGIRGISPLAGVTGLSPPAVHSVKTWEAMDGYGGGEERPEQSCLDGDAGASASADGATAVYAVRRDACYPEYLVTFALQQ